MVGKQTMTWNGDANTKLLLAILEVTDAKPDFDAVAKRASITHNLTNSRHPELTISLTNDTVTCTPRAVQEQLKKLRKIAANPGQGTDAPTTPTSTGKGSRKGVATPAAGVKKNRKPAAAAGGKGKKGKFAASDVDDAANAVIKAGNGNGSYQDAMNRSSDLGGDSLIGSEVEDGIKAEMGNEDLIA